MSKNALSNIENIYLFFRKKTLQCGGRGKIEILQGLED